METTINLTIEEKKELILVFMDFEYIGKNTFVSLVKSGNGTRKEILPTQYTKFDSDFDWIMPVVKRIEEVIQDRKDLLYFFQKDTNILCLHGYLYVSINVQDIFNTVIEFIQEYNNRTILKKWCLVREFIYGYDVTEFGDNQEVVLYHSFLQAKESLDEYIQDMNAEYKNGNLEEPYDGDVEIREVLVDRGTRTLFDVTDNRKHYKLDQP